MSCRQKLHNSLTGIYVYFWLAGCTLDKLPYETLLYIAQHFDAPSDLVSFGQSNMRLWSDMLPEIHEAKLRKMRSYASELREATAIIQMPQHVEEVASMTQLPVKKADSLMQIIAILARQRLAWQASVIQDYSDMYDAMVTIAMSASLKEVPAMTLQESHVAVALICRSRRKRDQASDPDLVDMAERVQTDCRLGLEGMRLGMSTLQPGWSVTFLREWLANQQK